MSWHLSSVKNERMWLSYGMDRMCDGLSPGGGGSVADPDPWNPYHFPGSGYGSVSKNG